MTTPTLIEGWEHGVLDTHQAGSGTGIADAINGAAVVDAASPIQGAYSLKLTHDRVTAANVTKTLASVGLLIGSSKFKTDAANPEQATTLLWFTGPVNTIKIRVNTDGTIGLQVGSGATAWSSVVVTDGAVHRVDYYIDVRAATWIVNWRIDGVAQTGGTLGSQATTGLTNFRWGSANAGDGSTAGWSTWHDDTFHCSNSLDYPLPNYEVRGYSPNADGTHNAGTNVIEADGGADIDGSTTTAFSRLDDVPLPTGSPAGDWVQQSQIDTARYAEVLFADESSPPGDILGVSGIVAYFASATAADNGTTRIVNGATGTTLTDIFSGDMSESSVTFVKAIISPPSSPWTLSGFNGLRARVGFSSDVTPTPRWCALMLQAAFRIEQTGAAAISGAGSLSASSNSDLTGAAALTGAGALSASGLAVVTGAAALTGHGDLVVSFVAFNDHIQFNAHVPFGGSDEAFEEVTGAAALTGSGTIAAAAAVTAFGAAALSGAGALVASSIAEKLGAADLAGAGSLVATPGPATVFGAAALTGHGDLDASSDVTAVIVRLEGFGTLVATGASAEIAAAAALAGFGTLVADADIIAAPSGQEPFVERADAFRHIPTFPARVPRPAIRELAWAELDGPTRDLYLQALRYSHPAAARIDLLDGREQTVGSLTAPLSSVYDGSVEVDTTLPVPRRLTLQVVDRDRDLLEFDGGSVVPGAISPATLVRVTRLDFVPLLGQWIAVPVFTGVITSYRRAGVDVGLEAMNKEYLYQGAEQNWRSVSVRRGARVVDAIRRIAEAQGETQFRLPEATGRLQAPVTVPQGHAAWPVIHRLADSISKQVYFDSEGRLTVRPIPASPIWAFDSEVDGANVLSAPNVTYDVANIRNTVHVVGKAPARGPRPSGIAVAPPAHPLSPQSLARGGVPRHIVERIEVDHLVTAAACRLAAQNRLAAFLIAGTSADFESLALPPVEPSDLAVLKGTDLNVTFRLQAYTMPLMATGAMQVGTAKQIPPGGARRRVMPGRVL